MNIGREDYAEKKNSRFFEENGKLCEKNEKESRQIEA